MRYLFFFCYCLLGFASIAWAQKTKAVEEETPRFTIQRKVDCGQFGLKPANFQRWKVARKPDPVLKDFRRKNPIYHSVITFPNSFPDDLILEASYKVSLLWPKKNMPTREYPTGKILVFGAERKPMSFTITHEHYYQVEKLEITAIECSRLIPPKQECPKEETETPIVREPIQAAPVELAPLPLAPTRDIPEGDPARDLPPQL